MVLQSLDIEHITIGVAAFITSPACGDETRGAVFEAPMNTIDAGEEVETRQTAAIDFLQDGGEEFDHRVGANAGP